MSVTGLERSDTVDDSYQHRHHHHHRIHYDSSNVYNEMIRNVDTILLLFMDVTQRILKGQAVREGLLWTAWPFIVAPIICPESILDTCQHTLRNIPEVRRPQLLRGGTLKSRLMQHPEDLHCLIFTLNSDYFPTALTDWYWYKYEMFFLSVRKWLFY